MLEDNEKKIQLIGLLKKSKKVKIFKFIICMFISLPNQFSYQLLYHKKGHRKHILEKRKTNKENSVYIYNNKKKKHNHHKFYTPLRR